MDSDKYCINRMSRSEVDIAIQFAADEGWNPGINDADCFYSADPNGFFIGRLNGEPVCTISAVAYNNNFGFIGLWIVKQGLRGNGYGADAWKKAIEYLRGREIGLDGVLELEENYKRKGFETAYYSSRFEGVTNESNKNDPRIVDLRKIPIKELYRYDKLLFPAQRNDFLKCWISRPDTTALGIMEDNNLLGYCVLRKCLAGYKIGPLFANDDEIAESLFQALINRVPKGTKIFIDIPEENIQAWDLVERHKMKMVFQTARMYRLKKGTIFSLPVEKWFGVTSFELG